MHLGSGLPGSTQNRNSGDANLILGPRFDEPGDMGLQNERTHDAVRVYHYTCLSFRSSSCFTPLREAELPRIETRVEGRETRSNPDRSLRPRLRDRFPGAYTVLPSPRTAPPTSPQRQDHEKPLNHPVDRVASPRSATDRTPILTVLRVLEIPKRHLPAPPPVLWDSSLFRHVRYLLLPS